MEKLNIGAIESELREWFENWVTFFNDAEIYVPYEEVREIEHNPYDGFIPFTNGGFMVTGCDNLRYAEGRGLTATEEKYIRQYIDSTHNDSAYDFIKARTELEALADDDNFSMQDAGAMLWQWFEAREAEHNEKYHSSKNPQLPGMPEAPSFWQTEAGTLREDYYQYSDDYLSEGGDYYYTVRAQYYAADNHRNDSGEDEIFFFIAINTDFTYGRDSANEFLASVTLAPHEVTTEKLEAIRGYFESALEDEDSAEMEETETVEVA